MKCISCDSSNITETQIFDNRDLIFTSGPPPHSVRLVAIIPVVTCLDCKRSFTDGRAERIWEETLNAYKRDEAVKEADEG